MHIDISRESFRERKHYRRVLLQQGRVQLDADWNEQNAIDSSLLERETRDIVGRCAAQRSSFQIAARATLDSMESTAGWSADSGSLCVDHLDFLRGTGSLQVAGATRLTKMLPQPLDLSGDSAAISFAVRAVPPDNGFKLFASSGAGHETTWTISGHPPLLVGGWQVYTCAVKGADAGGTADLKQITSLGYRDLKPGTRYRFDLLQRDLAPIDAPLQDFISLDEPESLNGWGIAAPGSVNLDGGATFGGRATLLLTGPGDAIRRFAQPRDLRGFSRVVFVVKRTPTTFSAFDFFLLQAGATPTKVPLTKKQRSTSAGWTTYEATWPAATNVAHIVGYGFQGITATNKLNVAQVLGELATSGNFYILGDADSRMYVDGILCQKEQTETYLSQADYPVALPITPLTAGQTRVDLVYVDVWQRHLTYVEDPELREVALNGADTCARSKTIAQVKVLEGLMGEAAANPLDCDQLPVSLKARWEKLKTIGGGMLTTVVTSALPADDPCEIAPDADFVGLDNRLYSVEIHDPGNVGTATFKWSKNNRAIVVAAVADIVPATSTDNQTVKVERLGRDKATAFVNGDWVEISDDLSDLSDKDRDADGLPRRRTGELRQVIDVDPDNNTLTLDTSSAQLTNAYTIARHAKVRKWDAAGPQSKTAAAFNVDTTPQLDFGEGVHVQFGGAGMLSGDYWQFTARVATGQVERLTNAAPAGVRHHYCLLALVKWQAVDPGGGAPLELRIVDIADCRDLFPSLTDIRATDVGYDDGCCGLAADAAILDPGASPALEVTNVQQALDILCAREEHYQVLRYVSGDGQEGTPNTKLKAPLVVAVENLLGQPQPGVAVAFTPVGLPDAESVGTINILSPGGTTGSDGTIHAEWQLGGNQGLNLVDVSTTTVQGTHPSIRFNARGQVNVETASPCCTITLGENGVIELQKAVDLLPLEGGCICIPRGTWPQSRPVKINGRQQITIEGCGSAATFIRYDLAEPLFTVTETKDIVFRDFAVGIRADIFHLHTVETARICNCDLISQGQVALVSAQRKNLTLADCTIETAAQGLVLFENPNLPELDVHNNSFQAATAVLIKNSKIMRVDLMGNTIDSRNIALNLDNVPSKAVWTILRNDISTLQTNGAIGFAQIEENATVEIAENQIRSSEIGCTIATIKTATVVLAKNSMETGKGGVVILDIINAAIRLDGNLVTTHDGSAFVIVGQAAVLQSGEIFVSGNRFRSTGSQQVVVIGQMHPAGPTVPPDLVEHILFSNNQVYSDKQPIDACTVELSARQLVVMGNYVDDAKVLGHIPNTSICLPQNPSAATAIGNVTRNGVRLEGTITSSVIVTNNAIF